MEEKKILEPVVINTNDEELLNMIKLKTEDIEYYHEPDGIQIDTQNETQNKTQNETQEIKR